MNITREGDHILIFALAFGIVFDNIVSAGALVASEFTPLTLVSEALGISAVFATIALITLAINRWLAQQGIEKAVRCGIWAAGVFVPITMNLVVLLGKETIVAKLIVMFTIVLSFAIGYSAYKYCAERAAEMQ